MDKYVLIVAGGKGLRMGGDLPKQFIPMRGKPLLMHTLEAFHRWDASARIILVLPEDLHISRIGICFARKSAARSRMRS